MSKNSVKKLVERARNLSSMENPPVKGLITLLESRLDVALFRASFFSSISMARQWINHKKVHVNKKMVQTPSYQLKGGDCIEVLPPSALSLKEKIKGRVGEILPFRRSRKKLVTPSLMENLCSLERLFPKEREDLFPTTLTRVWPRATITSPPTSANRKPAKSQQEQVRGKKDGQDSPALIENFSLIKEHLQSIWEKSVQSQGVKEKFLPQVFF